MGVKLQELLKIDAIDLSRLKGRIIAVDAPNIIFGLFNFAYKNHQYSDANMMLDRTQRPISHLYGLLYRVNFYYSKKMLPVFCFDGRVSELKRMQTKDFLNDFRFTKKWYENAIKTGDKDQARAIALSREFMWPNIMNESRQLLSALGVPYIDSPGAAEAQCAELVKQQLAHYSITQDLDSLLFGCPRTLQNLTKSTRRKVQGRWIWNKVVPKVISLKENLKMLRIDQFQLIDIAILIGVDYFKGIEGIGAKKAYGLIKKHGSLEEVIRAEKENFDFSKLNAGIIEEIRSIFLLPEVVSDLGSIRWDSPNKTAVNALMCEDHTLDPQRVKDNLEKTAKQYQSCQHYFKSGQATKPRMVQKSLF